MMVDPIGTTLAAIPLFFNIYDGCKRTADGIKRFANYGPDMEELQTETRGLWAKLKYQVNHKTVKKEELREGEEMFSLVLESLNQTNRYFQKYDKLLSRYLQNHLEHQALEAVVRPDSAHETSAAGLATVAQTSLAPLTSGPANQVGSVAQAEASFNRNAMSSQKGTSFFRKLMWADHGRENLIRVVDKIRKWVDHLGGLLQTISLNESSSPLVHIARDELEGYWPVMERVSRSLAGLHQDLREINRRSSSAEQYHLCVQLQERHDETRNAIGPHVRLREDSMVYLLQRQEAPRAAGDLLAIEAALLPEDEKRQIAQTNALLRALDRPQNLPATVDPQFETWGYVDGRHSRPVGTGSEAIHVLHHASGTWVEAVTLEHFLGSGDLKNRATPSQIAQLARLIVCSYLCFRGVFLSALVIPRVWRPENFCYYTTEEEDHWDVDAPLLLKPWLAFGFGRNIRRPFALSTGVAPSSKPAIVELGLLLYQLGMGELVDYGQGAGGLLNAQGTAILRLGDVARRMGADYMEVVKRFLTFKLYAEDATRIGEVEFAKWAISQLHRIEDGVSGAVSAPLNAPVIPDAASDSDDHQ